MNTQIRVNPLYGEIWYVDLEPTRGAELQKTRPAIVISTAGVGVLPLRLIVPLTGWNDAYASRFWFIKIEPTAANGLSKASAADVFQMRGVDLSRFSKAPVGRLTDLEMQSIAQAVAAVVDYRSPA